MIIMSDVPGLELSWFSRFSFSERGAEVGEASSSERRSLCACERERERESDIERVREREGGCVCV